MAESAAQRVFNLLDVVEVICEYTSERGPDGEFLYKKTLQRLALVNKVAAHAASRRLFRNIYGFVKFSGRIPSLEVRARTKHLSRPEKFINFTKMVHSFRAYEYGDSWDSFHLLEEFASLLPQGQAIFPNLREIGLPWELKGYKKVPFRSTRVRTAPMMAINLHPVPSCMLALQVFPTQNIRRLALHMAGSQFPRDAEEMAGIGALLPNLKSLDLSAYSIGPEWINGISAAICTVPNLKKVEINIKPAYIGAVISDLRNFRALRVLHLVLNDIGERDSTHPEDKDRGGRSLLAPLNVILSGNNNWSQAVAVLHRLRTHAILLDSLSILMDSQPPGVNSLRPITDLVASNHPEITRFFLQYQNISTLELYEQNLNFPFHDLLTPLLQLGNIVELDLRISGSVIVSKDALDTMAMQWPQLRRCHFSVEVYTLASGLGRTPVRLADVVEFATKCRELKTLGIALDATIPPESAEMPSMQAMTLSTLDVGSSAIDDGQYAARVMRHAFPALTDLYWTEDKYPRAWRMSEEDRAAWGRVKRAIFWD